MVSLKDKADSNLLFMAILISNYLKEFNITKEQLYQRIEEKIIFLRSKSNVNSQSQLLIYLKEDLVVVTDLKLKGEGDEII